MKLLTTSNPKTQKGVKRGYLTAIMHFAPSKLSGHNVCKDATPECIRFCLNKAGRGGIVKAGETTNAIQKARVARTRMWLDQPFVFRGQLIKEIEAHKKKATKLGLKACVRLNGTSDIAWEHEFAPLFWRFDDVQFYDYTKDFARMERFLKGQWSHKNYHLTFSRSELNDRECGMVLDWGGNVAAVFQHIPEVYYGSNLIYNGDADDLRFLDPQGICALTAKGKLRKYESAFKM